MPDSQTFMRQVYMEALTKDEDEAVRGLERILPPRESNGGYRGYDLAVIGHAVPQSSSTERVFRIPIIAMKSNDGQIEPIYRDRRSIGSYSGKRETLRPEVPAFGYLYQESQPLTSDGAKRYKWSLDSSLTFEPNGTLFQKWTVWDKSSGVEKELASLFVWERETSTSAGSRFSWANLFGKKSNRRPETRQSLAHYHPRARTSGSIATNRIWRTLSGSTAAER